MSFLGFSISTFYIYFTWTKAKYRISQHIVGFDFEMRGLIVHRCYTVFFRFNFAFGNFNFREKFDLHVCPLFHMHRIQRARESGRERADAAIQFQCKKSIRFGWPLRMGTKHVCNGKPNKWRDEMCSNLFMYILRPDGNYANLFVLLSLGTNNEKLLAFGLFFIRTHTHSHTEIERHTDKERMKRQNSAKSTHVNGIISTKSNVNSGSQMWIASSARWKNSGMNKSLKRDMSLLSSYSAMVLLFTLCLSNKYFMHNNCWWCTSTQNTRWILTM